MNRIERKDRIRGSLIGGAAGDALGYTIEFWKEAEIFRTYGEQGITAYELTGGKAILSDDTQMTLFTADGLLLGTASTLAGEASVSEGKEPGPTAGIRPSYRPSVYVSRAYQDWLATQYSDLETVMENEQIRKRGWSRLLTVPELFAWRAPGNTCLSALRSRAAAGTIDLPDYIAEPLNNSCGCGGIMRTAPLALRYRIGENSPMSLAELDLEAAQIAAITHSHSLGYMCSSVVNHVISLILTAAETMTLKEMVLDAADTMAELFAGDEHLPELLELISYAVALSEDPDMEDLDAIHRLGEGWTGHETMAIALYCSLKYQDDFSRALIVSVNHKGDSDSTGAVTGNIVGALVGYEAMEEKWKTDLELHDLILQIADELYA